MVENILMEHDPELLNHLSLKNITPKVYVWPILQTAFSEVLSKADWFILWDHILSNEPSYLLMVSISFNIVHRNLLLQLSQQNEFEEFFQNQRNVDIKALIKKSYKFLSVTSERNHPRQYLDYFKKLDGRTYPKFTSFPVMIEEYKENSKELNHLRQLLAKNESYLLNCRHNELNMLEEIRKDLEENVRLNGKRNVVLKR